MVKQRRVQSAYKSLLVDHIKEKDDRAKYIKMRRDRIQSYQQTSGFDIRDFVKLSIQISANVS